MFKYDIRHHCVARYRKHHPEATRREVAEAMKCAREVKPECILPILGRRVRPTDSRYYLVEDYRGVFVREGDTLITYLRLYPMQQGVARRLWPREVENEVGNEVENEVDAPSPGTAPEPLSDVKRYGKFKRLTNDELREDLDFYIIEKEDAARRLGEVKGSHEVDPEVVALIEQQRDYWDLWFRRGMEERHFRKSRGTWDKRVKYRALIPKYAHGYSAVVMHPDIGRRQAKADFMQVEVVDSTFSSDTWIERMEMRSIPSNREYVAYLRHPKGMGNLAVVEKEKDDPEWALEAIKSGTR